MNAKTDGEHIVELQTNVKNMSDKVNSIENSVQALHGKFDDFKDTFSKTFLPMSTFDEYKSVQKERDKNRILELVITALISSVITGLVAFFLREFGV